MSLGTRWNEYLSTVRPASRPDPRIRPTSARQTLRYGASAGGVAALTWLISLVFPRYHVGNISMVYLLLVLALAVFAGSGPAILASVLAFLAFDWFFVPPVGRITVSDPQEWLALFLFLVVALITGQLAAGLRRQAAEARRRAGETQTLYELSLAILGDVRLDRVLQAIAERLTVTLALRGAAIWIVDAEGALSVAAQAGEPPNAEDETARQSGLRWAFDSSSAATQYGGGGAVRVVRPLSPSDRHRRRGGADGSVVAFVPVLLGNQRLGVIAVYGQPGVAGLGDEETRLLEAFAAQTALAVSRSRLAAEEERAQMAAESERLKSTFLASISHDLRTPLTSIKAAASALQVEGTVNGVAERRELSASIEREADRLNRLVGNLLEISRLEAGGLPPQKTPEDLAEIVGIALERFRPLLRGHNFTAVIAPDLPLVPLDAGQIERVLGNLLENAVNYSASEARIVLEAFAEGGQVRVSLHNDGPLLSQQERERMFDKFYRLAPARGARAGTGLGLAICRGIVEAHGGRIWAENDAGGLSILFTLPLALQTDETLLPRASV